MTGEIKSRDIQDIKEEVRQHLFIEGIKHNEEDVERLAAERESMERPATVVSEPAATFTVRVDIRREIAEHNAKVLRGLVARMVRIFEEGDCRKTGAVINLLSVLDPRGKEE